MKEIENFISEMKVFNNHIKMVPGFYQRTLCRLRECSRSSISDQLPKAFSGFTEGESVQVLSASFYKIYNIRILSKHGFQFVTEATVKISSRL
jgi:hypothetical protein